jgi:small conductance mechanosensitive channel
LNHSFAVFDVPVEYSEQPDRLMETMKQVGAALQTDEVFGPMILEPLEIAGVDKFVEAGVMVKSRIKTLPGQQWAVGREFLRRLKASCDKSGIRIATAQRAVQLFEDGSPWRPA